MKTKRKRQSIPELLIKYKKWWLAALLLLLVYSVVTGNTGFYALAKLYFESRDLDGQIQTAKEVHRELAASVDSLKNDPNSIKKPAYDLGLAAEDEIIIVVDEEKK